MHGREGVLPDHSTPVGREGVAFERVQRMPVRRRRLSMYHGGYQVLGLHPARPDRQQGALRGMQAGLDSHPELLKSWSDRYEEGITF